MRILKSQTVLSSSFAVLQPAQMNAWMNKWMNDIDVHCCVSALLWLKVHLQKSDSTWNNTSMVQNKPHRLCTSEVPEFLTRPSQEDGGQHSRITASRHILSVCTWSQQTCQYRTPHSIYTAGSDSPPATVNSHSIIYQNVKELSGLSDHLYLSHNRDVENKNSMVRRLRERKRQKIQTDRQWYLWELETYPEHLAR